MIKSVQKTNRLVTVEEGWPQNGIGADISAVVCEEAFDHLDAPIERVSEGGAPCCCLCKSDVAVFKSFGFCMTALMGGGRMVGTQLHGLTSFSFDDELSARYPSVP